MSDVAQLELVRVELLGSCAAAGCLELAGTMRAKLDTAKYRTNVSLLEVPASLAEWRAQHRTARKRADRCGRLGYRFAEIDRSEFDDDIHAINTSLELRQGRPMEAGYLEWRRHGRLPDYPCDRHAIRTYGVLQGDRLRAYLTLYRVHELSLVSMILGHGAHLADDVMYLLFAGVVEAQAGAGGVFYYNRHDSGTEGLRYYKERLGFAAGEVEWQLGA